MKIRNPFKAKNISEHASLADIQSTFKGSKTLEVKNGVLQAQTRSLVHELKLKLGLDSAKARESVREFRRTSAVLLINEKIADSLELPSVASQRTSISGKHIEAARQQAEVDFHRPHILAALQSTTLPPHQHDRYASLLAKVVMAAAAEIREAGQGAPGSDLNLAQALDLGLETIRSRGVSMDKTDMINLHQNRQVAASPALRLQFLTRGIQNQSEATRIRKDPPFRSNAGAMAAVYYANLVEMRSTGAMRLLMDAICPSVQDMTAGRKADLIPMFADRLHQLADDAQQVSALVERLPEHFCVSVAVGLHLIHADEALNDEQKTDMADALASNLLSLRLLNPELSSINAQASAAFQAVATPKAPSFADYMKLIHAVAARGATFDSYRQATQGEAAPG
jgi:hypothetical protein